jgi:hypothetical protein
MLFSFNGCGIRLTSAIRFEGQAEKELDARYPGLLAQHEGAEFQVVIEAVTGLYIPLIPIKRMIILKLRDGRYIELEQVKGIVQHAIHSLGFQIGFVLEAIAIISAIIQYH